MWKESSNLMHWDGRVKWIDVLKKGESSELMHSCRINQVNWRFQVLIHWGRKNSIKQCPYARGAAWVNHFTHTGLIQLIGALMCEKFKWIGLIHTVVKIVALLLECLGKLVNSYRLTYQLRVGVVGTQWVDALDQSTACDSVRLLARILMIRCIH